MAFDAEGAIYVADTENRRIRAILPGGRVITLAGDGTPARRDGKGPGAAFSFPRYSVADLDGTLFVADQRWLRVVSPDGSVVTLLGSDTGTIPAGPLVESSLPFEPSAMALSASGKLIVADAAHHRILELTLGK